MRGAVSCLILVLFAGGLAAVGGCRRGPSTIAVFPVDSLEGVIDRGAEDVLFQPEESADGKGCLVFEAFKPRVVRLYEVAAPRNAAGRLIVLTARMKSVGVRGSAFPELWVHFADGRDVQASFPMKGLPQTRPWTELRAEYRCEPGEKPERLRVDAVIDGIGKAWIDDVRLTTEPLK
jgi:hypothetical protein